jgi:hypothetical protein
VRDEKVDVAFKAFEKTLVHGRVPPGEAQPAAQSVAPSAPSAPAAAASDPS